MLLAVSAGWMWQAMPPISPGYDTSETVSMDFMHISREGCLKLYEADHTYALIR